MTAREPASPRNSQQDTNEQEEARVMIPKDIELRDVGPPNKRPQRTQRHLIESIVVLVVNLLAAFAIRPYVNGDA
jgi:hypothetical protein